MTPRQIRTITIAKLAEDGMHMSYSSSMDLLCAAVEKITGIPRAYRQDRSSCLTVYAKPSKVEPRQPAPFRRIVPEEVKPHWRQADIDRAQRPVMTPGGTGNGHNFGGRLGSI